MDQDKEPHNRSRSTCAQVCAVTALYINSISIAMMIGMPVIVIGALRLQDDSLEFTEEEASWFGGVGFIVQPLGSVVSGLAQDVLGRKTSMILGNTPVILGWLMFYFASSVHILFVAGVLLGFSIGFIETPLFSYIGEISEPRLRGVLSTLNQISINVGFLIINGLGVLAEWRTMCLISVSAPAVSLIALTLIPESPAWLVSKGRVEEARKAHQWLRGWVAPQSVQGELDTLVNYVEENRQKATAEDSKLLTFMHPSVQRPLRLTTAYFLVGACASFISVKIFIIKIMTDFDVPVQPNLALVVLTAMTFLGTVTSTILMRRLGKRRLTFLSLGPSVLCCLALGLYSELGLHRPWVPLVIFGISYFSGGIGVMTIPWILISEIFPLRGRGEAAGVAGALGFLCYFTVIKTYITLVALMGDSRVYFLYATVGTLGFIYLYKYLPETEGVSLESIERFFWKPSAQIQENGKIRVESKRFLETIEEK